MKDGHCPTPRPFSWAHQFEARYDREPAVNATFNEVDIKGPESRQLLLDMTTKRTYVRDICVRCGLTIERVDNPVSKPQATG